MRAPCFLRVLVTAVVLAPSTALAYDVPVHEALPEWSFRHSRGEWLDQRLEPATAADLERLRRLIHERASKLPDAALRDRFLKRYPTADGFDARALRQLLAFNVVAKVQGLDLVTHTAAAGAGPTRVKALHDGSGYPDNDPRNQDRLQRDASGEPIKDRWGRPLPDDPATLDLGPLTSGASQGHAHYQLWVGPKSSDPEVLKNEPHRFATKADIQSFGADYAQIYTDLAVIAALAPELRAEVRPYLAAIYAGGAFHHVGDVGNQIHTVQVGIYPFFVAAKIGSILEDLGTGGGLWGQREGFFGRGLRIVTNHHFFIEALYRKRLLETLATKTPTPQASIPAAIREALTSLSRDDPEVAGALKTPAPGAPLADFGRGLTLAIVERASREGPEVYALANRLVRKGYRNGNATFKEGQNPDAIIDQPDSAPTAALLNDFYALQGRGLRRAATALRRWMELFEAAVKDGETSPERREALVTEALSRLVKERLDYLDAAEARRKAFQPEPPATVGLATWVPATYGGLLLGALGVTMLMRRRKRRAA